MSVLAIEIFNIENLKVIINYFNKNVTDLNMNNLFLIFCRIIANYFV